MSDQAFIHAIKELGYLQRMVYKSIGDLLDLRDEKPNAKSINDIIADLEFELYKLDYFADYDDEPKAVMTQPSGVAKRWNDQLNEIVRQTKGKNETAESGE